MPSVHTHLMHASGRAAPAATGLAVIVNDRESGVGSREPSLVCRYVRHARGGFCGAPLISIRALYLLAHRNERSGLVWLLALLEQFPPPPPPPFYLHTQPCEMAVDLQTVAGLLQASLDPAQNRQGTHFPALNLELCLLEPVRD